MFLKKTALLALLVSALPCGQVFAQSALFPEASWQAEHILGPGVAYAPSYGGWLPMPPMNIGNTSVRINQHMDRMIMEEAEGRIVFKRVCKDDVELIEIPNVDQSGLDKDLTVWEAHYNKDGGQAHTILFEQRGGGVLIGTIITHSENGQIGKGQYTVAPISDMPELPDDDQDEPSPDTPKEQGLQAVAKKLAAEMGVTPAYIRQYMVAKVADDGDLNIKVWLDANNRALHSERDIKDPCDPRYGNLEPAKSLYMFNIVKLMDDEGTDYFIKTQVIDVNTGIIQRQYAPDTTEVSGDLQGEVSDAYDGLGFDIKQP